MVIPVLVRDPVWQFIGVVVSVISLSFSVVSFKKQRTAKKGFTYRIVSNLFVRMATDVGIYINDNLKRLLDSKSVNEANVIVFRMWNSGDVPIERGDYEDNNPIKFNFGKRAEVLDATVVETTPLGLRHKVERRMNLDSGSLAIAPLLLNSGDSITFEVVVSGFEKRIRIDETRITGLEEFRNEKVKEKLVASSGISLTICCCILIFVFPVLLAVVAGIVGVYALFFVKKYSH